MTMLAAITADAGLGIWEAYGGVDNGLDPSSTEVRTGDRSFKHSSNNTWGSIALDESELYIRVAMNIASTADYNQDYGTIFMILDTAGGAQGVLCVSADTKKLHYYRGFRSTELAVSDDAVPEDVWIVYEIHLIIDNTNGLVEVRENGSEVISFSGDTQNTGNADIGVLRFGSPRSGGLCSVPEFYYDDIVVNNTSGTENNSWPGLGGLYYLKPDAAGDQTDLTPDSGSNHERVDEIEPDDDDSYVESDVVDEYDLYELEDLPADGVINAAIWHARAKLSESGEGDIARMLKIDGTEYQGSDEAITESYADKVEILELNPDDSAAWEKADIDALQAGVKVR